jgi:hypothetical protein
MAAVFARLPCKVLWRLSPSEVPDQAALAQLRLGNNTKARSLLLMPGKLNLWSAGLMPATMPSVHAQVLMWVPQNDVLAHPNTRAFLSHVGVNSQYEAVYHSVPVVAMPAFADQYQNADKVVAKVSESTTTCYCSAESWQLYPM